MRIERLKIPGFGRLGGTASFDTSRCNLIVAPNEAGKSTLVAALVAALYGFPSERRSKHNPIPDRDAFLPWQGGAFGVELDFRLGDDSYRILRDFQTDRVEIQEGRTGKDVSQRFRGDGGRPEILEHLLGLERDDFSRSALVGQDEIQVIREGGDITLRLQKFATSRGSDITAGEALECLEEALRRYPGTQLAGSGKVDTEIQRLDDRLVDLRDRRHRLQSEHDEASAELAELEALAGREQEVVQRLHQLDYLRTRAILQEIDAAIAEQERIAAEHASLQEELESLADLAEFPLGVRAELSELKGKADELILRIAGAQQEQEVAGTGVEQEVAHRLQELEDLERFDGDDLELVESLAVRLRDRRERLQSARKDARKLRKQLRRGGFDIDQSSVLEARFAGIAAEEAEFLRGHRERALELEALHRDALDLAASAPEVPQPTGTLLWIAGGSVAAAAGILVWTLLGRALPGVLLLLAGLVLTAFGLLRLRRRSGPEVPAAVRAMAADSEALRDRLDTLSEQLQFPDGDELLAAFRQLEALRREGADLAKQEQSTSDLEEELMVLQEESSELLRRAGRVISPVQIRPRDLEHLRDDLRELTPLRQRMADLEERSRRDARTLAEIEERLAATTVRMREILASAGLETGSPGTPVEPETLRQFEQSADRAERRTRIQEEFLPGAQERLAAPGWLAGKQDERRTMQQVLEQVLERGPLDPLPEPEHSSNHYVLEFKQADEELRQAQRRRREVFGRVADLLRRYREEMPQLTAEQHELEAARERAERFGRAVRLAAERLQEISRESYEEWATALNSRANRILVHLNPAYRDLRFDTDLSFTLEEVATGRRLARDQVDAHLSAGARDQIYLAIRLAVCDYFSAGRYRLPLILDDPFTAADDDRFDRAMVFLAERISTRHQVILLSCQAERHRRFRERHRDLFDARIAQVSLPARTEDLGV